MSTASWTQTLVDLWRLGGYGAYVWGSVAAVALSVAVEIWGLSRRRAAALRVLRVLAPSSGRASNTRQGSPAGLPNTHAAERTRGPA